MMRIRSAAVIDVDDLLRSLGDEAPCGENLEYDADYVALEMAAQPVEERAMGDAVLAAEEPDWEAVTRRAVDLLGRTRDLRVAAILANAALRADGLPGFAQALGYARACLELHWDHVHPQLDREDDDDPTMRVNAALGLADPETVLRALRLAPLTDSRAFGRFALRDMLLADGEIAPADDREPVPDPQSIAAALRDTPPERLARVAAAVEASLAHVAAIGREFDARIGMRGPDLDPLTKTLRDIRRRLPEPEAEAPAEGPGAPAEAAPASAPGAAPAPAPASAPVHARPAAPAPGVVAGPDDVIAALDRIVDYYRRQEPSSPLPFLLARARRLVRADFVTVVRELAPMGLENVALVGGVPEHSLRDDD